MREAAVYQTPGVCMCVYARCRPIEDRLVDLLNCRAKREKKREREREEWMDLLRANTVKREVAAQRDVIVVAPPRWARRQNY